MNKRSVRAFAFGLFFAVAFIGASGLIFEEESDITVKEAKAFLKKEGFVTLSKDEYNSLKEEKSEQEVKEEKPAETKEQTEPPPEVEQEEKVEEPESEKEKVIQYNLEITSGMYVSEIARKLVEAKIIADKNDFEQFLMDHDYNTKVQIGVFELNSSMGYEEIAKIITKS